MRARLRSLLRRSAGHAAPLLTHGGISLDPSAQCVLRDGQPVALTPREFALLELLLLRSGRVVTRTDIAAQLQGWTAEAESNVLEVHVSMLRKKLGDRLIRTIRGVGYMIEKPLA